jgi:hypothetical protein
MLTESALGIGLLLGLRHATEPDHVVAVAAIASREKSVRGASLIGTSWGVGHALVLWLIGGLVLAARWEPPVLLSSLAECLVGVLLVALGADTLRRTLQRRRMSSLDEHHLARPGRSIRQSFFMGTVHGLAGSAAAVLLALTAARTPWHATVYLVLFGVGILLGMLVLTTLFAVPMRWARGARIARGAQGALGASSVAIGISIVVATWPPVDAIRTLL